MADLNLSNLNPNPTHVNPNPNPNIKTQPKPNPYPNTKIQPNHNPDFTTWELAKPRTVFVFNNKLTSFATSQLVKLVLWLGWG